MPVADWLAGDEREEWEKHLAPEKAERNGTAPTVSLAPSKASHANDLEVANPPHQPPDSPVEATVDAEMLATLGVPS